MILLVDNRDSFVYNLARYFERLGQTTRVLRSDTIDSGIVRNLAPDAVVLSPGPCTPDEAGASLEIVRELYREVPMLGVCLGHQVIAAALGSQVVRAKRPVHGQASAIRHAGSRLFAGMSSPFQAGRYHSLVVDPEALAEGLRPTAWSEDDELMAFEHESLPIFGVQFHPESILTNHGYELLANFLRLAGQTVEPNAQQLARGEVAHIESASVA